MDCFEKSSNGTELRQGEILTGINQYEYFSSAGEAQSTLQEYVIVVNQDCDLLREFESKQSGEQPVLNGVLLLPLATADAIKTRQNIKSDIWRRVTDHREDRYHKLLDIRPQDDLYEAGLPQLVADFRLMFTVPPEEVLYQIKSGSAKRRSRLVSPYREHFQSRFAFYLHRVALP